MVPAVLRLPAVILFDVDSDVPVIEPVDKLLERILPFAIKSLAVSLPEVCNADAVIILAVKGPVDKLLEVMAPLTNKDEAVN